METIGKHLLIYDNVTYYLLTNKVVLFKHPFIDISEKFIAIKRHFQPPQRGEIQ